LWNVIGVFAGSYLPDLTSLGLDFAIAVTFIALVIPSITTVPILVAVVVSAVCSVAFKILSWELDLVLASLAGMLAGYFTSRLSSKNSNAIKPEQTQQEEPK